MMDAPVTGECANVLWHNDMSSVTLIDNGTPLTGLRLCHNGQCVAMPLSEWVHMAWQHGYRDMEPPRKGDTVRIVGGDVYELAKGDYLTVEKVHSSGIISVKGPSYSTGAHLRDIEIVRRKQKTEG